MNFDTAFDRLLGHEGGLLKVVHDFVKCPSAF